MESLWLPTGTNRRTFSMSTVTVTRECIEIKPSPPPPVSATLQITCGKEVIGALQFRCRRPADPNAVPPRPADQYETLVPGCAKRCRRYMRKRMGMSKKDANVVILMVMLRYTKSDHVFGGFDFRGRTWKFTDPDFEEAFAEERKKNAPPKKTA